MTPVAKKHLEQIHDHAVEEYPYECCGIIIGKPGSGKDTVLYRCTNIQNKLHEQDPVMFVRDARTAFYIDPGELMRIIKEAENRGMNITTFYHSHPDHDAYFSEEDKRMALFDNEPVYPDASYLVVSVRDGQINSQALFAWDPDQQDFAQSKDL
jgi:proteasome lid subunit RPN8/RPN11